MKELSHTDPQGKARMVDVGHKKPQLRVAKASGFIQLQSSTLELVNKNQVKKGDVLTVAEIAGVQAAKRTADLIPLCHTIFLDQVLVQTQVEEKGIRVSSEVRCTGTTGVEMEALTAVSLALLTIYDMCKAVDKTMVIGSVQLDSKTKTDIP